MLQPNSRSIECLALSDVNLSKVPATAIKLAILEGAFVTTYSYDADTGRAQHHSTNPHSWPDGSVK